MIIGVPTPLGVMPLWMEKGTLDKEYEGEYWIPAPDEEAIPESEPEIEESKVPVV